MNNNEFVEIKYISILLLFVQLSSRSLHILIF